MYNAYLQAFNAVPFPCLLLEPAQEDFKVRDVNDECIENLHLFGEESHDRSDLSVLEKNLNRGNLEQLKHSFRKVLETGEKDVVSFRLFEESSFQREQFIPEEWNSESVPIKDPSGAVVQIFCILMPGNEENRVKQVPTHKNAQNEEYETFINKNKDGLYSLDTEGNFLSLNKGLSEMAELSQEEMLKTSFIPFCAKHDRKRTVVNFEKALAGESQVFEAEFISAGGNSLVLEITLFPMNIEGKIRGVYGIAKDRTPVKERETEYFRNEKRFKALVQEGLDMLGILEPDGTYKFVSDTVRNVLGTEPKDYINKNAFDFIHPEDKEKVMADFSLLGNKRQVRISLFRFKDGEGNWRWMETLVTNLLDDPYVEGLVTNSREVTELIEKSQKIRQLYERYTLAAEATEDVIYDWDLITDEVIRFHKSAERLFGYSRKEIDDPDFWRSNIHPEDLPEVLENLNLHLDDPDQRHIKTQYRFRRADGSYAQIIDRSSIVRNERGEAIRLIGATVDISEITGNREALKMANRRFSYAMKATKEMIWDWDVLNGGIKRSSSFRKIFGYSTPKLSSAEELWFDKIIPKDQNRIRRSLNAALEDPTVKKWREEYCFLRKNGEEAHVIDRGYILRDREGRPIRMVGAVLDVTESRRMIKEIKHQNKVLKEVAWEQAHVVRAPLARLKGLLDLLEEESYEEWSREELVNLIKKSADEVDLVIEKIIRKTERVGS